MPTFSLKAPGDDSPLPLPSFSWLLAILSISWFVDVSLQSLPLSSHCNLSISLYAIFPLCMWIFVSSYGILPFVWMYLNIFTFKNASYWIGAYLSRGWSHLNLLTSAHMYFEIWSQSEVDMNGGGRNSTQDTHFYKHSSIPSVTSVPPLLWDRTHWGQQSLSTPGFT